MSQMEVIEIALDQLVPSPHNPRRNRAQNTEALKALGANIRAVGLLQPIVVRPAACVGTGRAGAGEAGGEQKETKEAKGGKSEKGGKGKKGERPRGPEAAGKLGPGQFEIMAGERRWRAAGAVGLETIAAHVRELTDAEALEITVVENMQREDLHPLEEAAGFAELREAGWDVASIASRFGRSEGWVLRRLALNRLTAAWRKAIDDQDNVCSRIPLGVIESIARLPEKLQGEILAEQQDDWIDEELLTAAGFRKYLERQVLQALSGAPWKMDDGTLEPEAGPCSECTKRTGHEPLLFEDLVSAKGKTVDRCLDAVCYQKKLAAALKQKVAAAAAEHPDLVCVEGWESCNAPRPPDLGRPVLNNYQYEDAKRSDKGAKPAVIVRGPRAGQTCWVKVRAGAGKTATARPRDAKGQVQPKSLAERRKDLDNRRKAKVIIDLRAELLAPAEGRKTMTPACLDPERPDGSTQLLALLAAFGTGHRYDSQHAPEALGLGRKRMGWPAVAGFAADPRACVSLLYRSLCRVLEGRLNYFSVGEIPKFWAEAEQTMRLIGADAAAIWTKVCAAIPEPKGWAKLNADGTGKSIETTGSEPRARATGRAANAKEQKEAKGAKKAKKLHHGGTALPGCSCSACEEVNRE